MKQIARKKGKKGRKIGRSLRKCEKYRLVKAGPNKAKRLARHVKSHVNDSEAATLLGVLIGKHASS